MNPLKALVIFILLSISFTVYSADSFEFDPQLYSAHIDTNHVYFIENETNTKTGPELYADETNTDFINLVKSMINSAIADNETIYLIYENINSQNHGEYKRIIPDF